MKGRNTFTNSEINEIRSLIRQRTNADPSRQKSIRAKMRRIGFYGSDFGIKDLQLSDLDNLIKSGRIKVIGAPLSYKNEVTASQAPISKEIPKPSLSGFRKFDPQTQLSSILPDSPGNYIVCLRKGSDLPEIGIEYEVKSFQGLRVIYTGIAGKSLRKRDYRQHFNGNAGGSTLRKSIGSLFGYKKIPRDKDPNSGKTKFSGQDESKLSDWMHSNLIMFFQSNSLPEKFEDQLIREFNPPLNLSKNQNLVNSEYRRALSILRRPK